MFRRRYPQRGGVVRAFLADVSRFAQKHPWTNLSNRRDSHFLGRLPGFLLTSAKNNRKRDLSFYFFHSSALISLSLSLDLGNSSSDNVFLRNWSTPAAFSFDRVLRTIATINDAYRLIWIKLISSNRNRLTLSFVCTRILIEITMRNSKTRGGGTFVVRGTFDRKFSTRISRLALNGTREPFSWN